MDDIFSEIRGLETKGWKRSADCQVKGGFSSNNTKDTGGMWFTTRPLTIFGTLLVFPTGETYSKSVSGC